MLLTDGPLHFCRTVSDFGWSQHPSFHRFVQSQQGTSGFGIQAVLHISERRMVKYFCNNIDIRSTWDHVVSAFWQRYPNPFRYRNIFMLSILTYMLIVKHVVDVKIPHTPQDILAFFWAEFLKCKQEYTIYLLSFI